MNDAELKELERAKQQIDYVKHMTTLATGSILLLATFLEKVFTKAYWKPLVILAFSGFILSVIGAVVNHTVMVGSDTALFEKSEGIEERLLTVSLFAMWTGFLLGVISLSAFSIRNFFT